MANDPVLIFPCCSALLLWQVANEGRTRSTDFPPFFALPPTQRCGADKPPSLGPSTNLLARASQMAHRRRCSRRPQHQGSCLDCLSYWASHSSMLTLCLSLSDSCARSNGDLLQDCRKRFFHSLAPDLKKGRWSKEEDALLLKGLEEMGPIWYKVRPIPQRSRRRV